MRTYRIPAFPLYWRMTDMVDAPRPAGIPARAAFAFTFDAALGLIRQEISPDLERTMENVYRAEANVGYLQVGQSLADGYGQDLWQFIQRAFDRHGKPKTALEIGCGGCYILNLLAKANVDSMGIDPSPIAIRTADAMGFKVVEGFFPHPDAQGPFDLILHSDVLEHVTEPVAFLKRQAENLTTHGLIVAAVPDCSQSNAVGDLSMIIHQHINYFDKQSLSSCFRAADLEPLVIERSGYGGSLYCLARRSGTYAAPDTPNSEQSYESFCRLADAVVGRFSKLLKETLARGQYVGCYVPLRAFPYLALTGELDSVRLFDDSAEMAHHYFDGSARRVETFDDLCKAPCDVVFVMSHTFGDRIKDKIRRTLGESIRIITLTELSSD